MLLLARIYLLLGTRAKLFRRCHIHRNSGTSVKRSMPLGAPTLLTLPCNHSKHANVRDEASG